MAEEDDWSADAIQQLCAGVLHCALLDGVVGQKGDVGGVELVKDGVADCAGAGPLGV